MNDEELAKLGAGARMAYHRDEAVRHLRAYAYSPATDNGGIDAKSFAALMAVAIESPELREETLDFWTARLDLNAKRRS